MLAAAEHNLRPYWRVLLMSRTRARHPLEEARIREFLSNDYARLVVGLSFLAGGYANAEEAVQDALARAWERAERGENIESLTAWVAVAATNRLRSALRHLLVERRVRTELESRIRELVSSGAETTDERLDVARAIGRLPRRQREVVVLFYFADLTVREVAGALSMNEGAVKGALHRARESIGRALAEATPQEEVNEPRR
jgi:RNA polymerase sigma-70 factor, ECF subfamily